ncbi:MAG: 3-hydroxyacyl-CoA dehydrogenase NAD-binding domain-containing protein [Gammaproteobacteria bacterium]
MTKNYQHWRYDRDPEQIVWLSLDKAGSNTNTLSADVLQELDQLLDAAERDGARGLVIQSAKAAGFIAGADISSFTQLTTEAEALALIQNAHALFNRLATLPFPTIALIHGYCLGGGLELALACRYRIADDDANTRLGLPEVKLGIHPGFGGTLRSIQRIGAPAAMDLMLSGRSLSARAAKKVGLIDYAVPQRQLRHAVRGILQSPPAAKKLPFWIRVLNHRQLRPWLAKYLTRKVAGRAPKAHYPAPYALIDLWVRLYDNPEQMLAEEAASVARLIMGKTAQNLIRVFFLQEQLKAAGQLKDFDAKRVHVIGGGVMGGDIAIWCALKGYTVTLQDQKNETIAQVMKRAYGLYSKRLKDRRLIQRAMDRLIPDPRGDGITRADLVIEAIFEDPEVKRNLFAAIEPKMKASAILATNTSSIPLQELATVLARPERLVGLHFFNPVAKMPLVEIVHGPQTDARVQAQAAAFARSIDRLPLAVTSSPGFLVNRVLMPYLMEAVYLADEGIPLKVIDDAALAFGMPMGPVELADTVGLDICLKVAQILAADMNITIPDKLVRLVEKGHLGKKTGRGFYHFKNGRPVKPPIPKDYTPPTDIRDRLLLRLLNEATACVHDGVVDNTDAADAGIIFGTGFAPFRGGPFHYIKDRGQEQTLKLLEHLEQRYGERFKQAPGWDKLSGI